MKKIFVSMGLVAAGTAGLQAAYAPDAGNDASKVWNVSATLRGFYDDNYLTSHTKHGSFGFEASPSLQANVPLQQTEIGVKYTYGLYYYQQRENNGQNPVDQTHQFDLWIDHAFSPRWEARVQDSVVRAQEPDLNIASGAFSTAQRASGDYVVNNAHLTLNTVWTQLLSTELSYNNVLVSYDNGGGTAISPSYAGLLDRDENYVALNLKWQLMAETVGFVGYQFGAVNYTADEAIAPGRPGGGDFHSDDRNNLQHFGYVGVQHNLLENLTANARVGFQYADYYNDPSGTSSWGPYADVNVTYTYMPGGYAQVGVLETRNATDQVFPSGGKITLDQESTVVYATVNHPITAKLIGSLVGRYQHGVYHGGGLNDESADWYSAGLDLAYNFNRHFSADIGYNFDYYSAPAVLVQSYTRNRVYVGVTGSY
jgi:hypothetical protein